MNDYYEILEISPTACQQQVRDAFRRKAKCLHPDLNHSTTANNDFQLINEAYQVLCDQNKRKQYDLRRHNGHSTSRVYYQPGKVRYRARGDKYAHYRSREEAHSHMDKYEKYFDFALFVTLLFVGIFSLIYGIYRLWISTAEEINPLPGIVMGIFFTSLMIFVWKKKSQLHKSKK